MEPDSERFTLTMSSTGMPSVMHTISGISASIASQMAVSRAGRRNVDHAGVAAGFFLRLDDGVEHRQTRWVEPPLPGDRAADHLGAVGDGRSEWKVAVLAGEAWQMTLVSLVIRTDISIPLHRFDDFLRGIVEIVGGQHVQAGFLMIFLPRVVVGAFEPHHQRNFQARLPSPRRRHFGDEIALHYAAEDVDQNALYVGVDVMILNARRDALLGGAAANVEEVRRASP